MASITFGSDAPRPSPNNIIRRTDAPPRPTQTGSLVAISDGPLPPPSSPPAAPPPGAGAGTAAGAPYDPNLQAILTNDLTSYDNTVAGLNTQEGEAYHDSGYNAQGQFDPSNPFSKAALLQRSYKIANQGANTSFAARGGWSSGAYQDALNQNLQGYNQGVNATQTTLSRLIAKLEGDKAAAEGTRERNDAIAKLASTQGAINNNGAQTQTPNTSGTPTKPKTVLPRNPKPVRTSKGGTSKTFAGIG